MYEQPDYGSLLRQLASRCRILLEYVDNDGVTRAATDDTLQHLITAMGFACGSDADVIASLDTIERRRWETVVEPITLCRSDSDRVRVTLTVPGGSLGDVTWETTDEAGGRAEGSAQIAGLPVVGDGTNGGRSFRVLSLDAGEVPPIGYYDMALRIGDTGLTARTRIIVYPPTCYVPDSLLQGSSATMLCAQLNSIVSEDNWGTGTLRDVEEIACAVAPFGVRGIGLSPLHPPQPNGVGEFSPYLATSRGITDLVRIDVSRAAEDLGCWEVRGLIDTRSHQHRLAELRRAEIVHPDVGRVTFEALEALWREFKRTHVKYQTRAARDFDAFVRMRGRRLRLYATYAALREDLMQHDTANGDWRNWPVEYRNPHNPEVGAFAERAGDRIALYSFIEWIARDNVRKLMDTCRACGMDIGPYFDLAMSSAAGGADTWMDPSLVVLSVTVGFPPDALGPQGQNIGSPPMNPFRVREELYESWIGLLGYTMDGAGAIRIDHFPQVERLLWIPVGKEPKDGAYVLSFRDELLAILAVESTRRRCIIIGEDLGTVPEIVRQEMADRNILSYRVQRFERRWQTDGRHIPPKDWPAAAIGVVTTHDLALAAANWSGEDIALRRELNLDPPDRLDAFRVARDAERKDLLRLLVEEGLITPARRMELAATTQLPEDLLIAIHLLLKRTGCMLLGIELGDGLGLRTPYNVPGTSEQVRPNWRTRQPITRSRYLEQGPLKAVLTALNS